MPSASVSIFRSEEMTLAQLYLQADAAYNCVSALGELGAVHFRDLNPDINAFQRKFVSEVRRCEDVERQIRFLMKEMQKANVVPDKCTEIPSAPLPQELFQMQTQFMKYETDLKQINNNYETLARHELELQELDVVLCMAQTFFNDVRITPQSVAMAEIVEEAVDDLDEGTALINIHFICGTIRNDHKFAFEKLLWRVCLANAFVRISEQDYLVEDPKSGESIWKSTFIIFFQGDRLRKRIEKICDGMTATLYPCPDDANKRQVMIQGLATRLEDVRQVLKQSKDHQVNLLTEISHSVEEWFIKIRKMKAIFHTLNLFNVDVTQKCLIAECWCPVFQLADIQNALQRGSERSQSSVPSILHRIRTEESPPTYHRTNKFTTAFQSIVDAYGVADYQEVNPALYTVITFPFLFAVMFGDCGHGLLMFLFAVWLIYREKKFMKESNGEMFDTIFNGRYVILLMGAFAIYTGLIYNDVMSKSLNIFGTGWIFPKDLYSAEVINNTKQIAMPPDKTFSGSPYPFGVDPIWQLALNKLTFLNSFKMKLSVILGITHMLFGVILSLFNHVYFKNRVNIVMVFIPEVIFLLSIFGYLVIMIFYKWCIVTTFSERKPSLLITLINMVLSIGTVKKDQQLYTGQAGVQVFLVVLAVICVPWMLLGKPLYLYYRHKHVYKRSGNYSLINDNTAINDDDPLLDEQPSEEAAEPIGNEFEFGEIFINNAIHTIEYVLGCISNTASYLRLWALSLAHAELSEVLWNMEISKIINLKIGHAGAFVLFGAFAGWAGSTVAILLVMEGLSAFLHALRLHWVEFQNKFYSGMGYLFQPFTLDVEEWEDEN
ncbi:uncharacterized protein TRIADDRAFT_30908 [Trichoplax adhaerens]|uniref:V-type proton ATPase subunit a n=1 Tax=Trichoplax adhaerens TaxID=10228 RepID=B3S864_TRIAD|nr:hypothetical protein TRIADDRAFT_30908 [Trichoplax adhaerens]EDV21047.1 hypothetical protein TRIADDRAFT_30908 [Trichoplax adhaerens]|eukprot:XP_002116377.1 hypothetical protein TRIADDRAFT_30908 [Trichoplax adhaerens]